MVFSTALGCPCSGIDSIPIPSSPLPDRIGTNYAPTTFERMHTESALTNVHQDLARLENALSHLHAVQVRLQVKRDALQKYADAHTALLSPIRRVPPEILAKIFLYFLPNEDNDYTADARGQRMLPSHICARWRDLSLSTPSFWAHISVVVDKMDISRKLECAKCWLARSGSCPLKIYICRNAPGYTVQQNSFIEIILPHCRRWLHASIVTETVPDLSLIKNNLPMLESVEIELAVSPNDSFQFAPKLCQLATNAEEILTNAILPWNQLTHIDVTCCSSQQLLAVMHKLPNMVSCMVILSSSRNRAAEPLEYRPIRLEHLDSLGITVETDINIAGFHECLDLPALKNYTYSEGIFDVGWHTPSFLSLISRSSCVLRDIVIQLASPAGPDHLALLFGGTPSLKTLDFNCHRLKGMNSNMVLDQLLVTPSSTSCLVPKLNMVTLDYDKDFDFHILLNMIQSRWKLDERPNGVRKTPIAEVEVYNIKNTDVIDHGLAERFRELKADGLVTVNFFDKEGKKAADWACGF
ncbi:hypothetical protein FIBSPDRAFT_359533 [Athelia psychrophila]|uniref:Uncharacterized protein n=1 Tax=Athelia psychrophila TaxID=1759441 RepID=A0A167VQK0_9AGAM|nr:hypothetical protein FIBSPDRAFT_359533 [Fibularhizoctonia sp. CBS 109695]